MKKWLYKKIVEIIHYKRHLFPCQPIRGYIERFMVYLKRNDIEIKQVGIQIAKGCNYSCSFCAQKDEPKIYEFMDGSLFDRIISELRAMDFHGILCPYLDGESMLHPNYVNMVIHAAKQLPKAEIQISTNGSLMTIKDYCLLLEQPNVVIWLDTHGHKDVIEKVKSWPAHKRAFIDEKKEPDGLMNWAGSLPTDFKLPLKQGCQRANTSLSITFDGKVRSCGLDTKNKQVVGDLKENTIVEIWYNEKWTKLRWLLRNNDRSWLACAKCDESGLYPCADTRYIKD